MEYTLLGNSGLKVSRIALGCMSFGLPGTGCDWMLDEDAAEPIFRQALDLGITFWDTANVYGVGTSEEIVGRAIKKYTTREQIVLATKQFWPMHEGPGGTGLSRKAIIEQTDASLRRLGTDYVDLMQIHRFDPEVPVAETMEALHDVVKSGRSATSAHRPCGRGSFSKMQYIADLHGWTKFISDAGPVQPHPPRGGARDVRPPGRPGRRLHPLEPAERRHQCPPVGRPEH